MKPVFLMLMFGFQSLLFRGIFWVSFRKLYPLPVSELYLVHPWHVVLMGFGGNYDGIQRGTSNVGLNPISSAKIGYHCNPPSNQKTTCQTGEHNFHLQNKLIITSSQGRGVKKRECDLSDPKNWCLPSFAG